MKSFNKVMWIVIAALAALSVWGFMQAKSNREYYVQTQRDRAQYITDHKCERVGYAGKDAIPMWKCDTGLWLYTELPHHPK